VNPAEYRVVATNPATASENRIHSDEEARRHGFRGGLVPGVTVYGYLVHAVVDAFGPEWVATGAAEVRFRQPCYEGETLTIGVATDGGVTVISGDTTCVTGEVWIDGTPDAHPEAIVPGVRPPAERRPAASKSALAPGTPLGSVFIPTDQEAADAYLAKIQESSDLYRRRRWLHPGLLLEGANSVLTANVVLPLWLHVGSEIGHRRPVEIGEPVEVRARVAELWERRGHQFLALDVVWLAADDVVATAKHTAIWELATSSVR
jgi:acyl dehydratase